MPAVSSTPATSMPTICPTGSRGRPAASRSSPTRLDVNDMRFVNAQGFGSGDQFYGYLKDSFDVLYAEGETSPKMMSVGLDCRLVGRPGRAAALMRFLDYIRVMNGSGWRRGFRSRSTGTPIFPALAAQRTERRIVGAPCRRKTLSDLNACNSGRFCWGAGEYL